MIMTSEQGCWWWEAGTSAPPLQVPPHHVKGWAQQMTWSPWAPISPMTVSTGYKYGTSPNRRLPTTFQWIINNDPKYVKWVLERGPSITNPNMLLLNQYLREHYTQITIARDSMDEALEEKQIDIRRGLPAVTMFKMPTAMMTALPPTESSPKRARMARRDASSFAG